MIIRDSKTSIRETQALIGYVFICKISVERTKIGDRPIYVWFDAAFSFDRAEVSTKDRW